MMMIIINIININNDNNDNNDLNTSVDVAFDYLELQQYNQTPSKTSLQKYAMPELASKYTTTMRKSLLIIMVIP